MAINKRQNSLLAAENWKKIYQTFQDADFTSYDFETLRKSMIDYLRINYPEDFNDFTESSEYVALIDLIAFMGQSLAFRTDLNARENFIDTAERRDSILKLARLVGYNPKRNIPASGFLKVDSISTTETIYDSNGFNLSNLLIYWDDKNNVNWLEQFGSVINAALVSSQIVGKPGHSQTINSIRTDEYTLNLAPNTTSISQFQALVENGNVNFEVVSSTSLGKSYIYEVPPKPNSLFNLLYKNDSYGNSSNNTGFFVYFKQGELQSQDFSLNDSLPNRTVPVNFTNINQIDVWLYGLSSSGGIQDLWKEVPSTSGVNVIYTKETDKNLYQINTKNNDQIDLIFGDGVFTNIPKGPFRVYFRTGNGLTYKITPNELQNVIIPMTYVSRAGRLETLTLKASLKYTVINASSRETLDDIKQKAPQQYYSQNRMITGEDYNILPFTSFSNVVKVKSINRTSSGISKYLDILDPTGKYSSTNSFGNDGILYKNETTNVFTLNFSNFTNTSKIIYDSVIDNIINSKEFKHFYYENYPSYDLNNHIWNLQTSAAPAVTGYFSLATVENFDLGLPYLPPGISGSFDPIPSTNPNSNLKLTVNNLTKNLGINQTISPFIPIVATGGTKPYSYSISPDLPKGVLMGASTGRISGNPKTTFPVTPYVIAVIDSTGSIATAPFLLSVNSNFVDVPADANTDSRLDSWDIRPEAINASSNFNINYIKKGAIIKFKPAPGNHFDANNNMIPGSTKLVTDKMEIFAGVLDVSGPYNKVSSSGLGPISLSTLVPNGAIVDKIYPVFKNSFFSTFISKMVDLVGEFKNFGVAYNSRYQSWRIITNQNLNIVDDFSLKNEGDYSNTGKDSSWLIRFEASGSNYKVYYRVVEYVFESLSQVAFLKDEKLKIYDPKSGQTINDQITIFKTNSGPDSFAALGADYVWSVYKSPVAADGYMSNSRVLLTYTDSNFDGIPDNPELFAKLVNPKFNPNSKMVYFKTVESNDRFNDYESIKEGTIVSEYRSMNQILNNLNYFLPGQIFYTELDKKFYRLTNNNTLETVNGYKASFGRQNLYFQYRHNSPESRRIDPGTSNVIDVYVLTSSYEKAYRNWISDTSGTMIKPIEPSSIDLATQFASLNDIRSVSDTMIFHSAVFKPLFGFKSPENLRAVFKVVKNQSIETSDNDIKTSVVNAINNYFDIANWDFGETFYFSELAAYLHQVLVPNISSIIIVPANSSLTFGHLYQINSEPNEIFINAATVENVEIITALTASQLNVFIK